MPSIIPTILREIKDDIAKQSLEMIRKCLGFVYSNENLGLEIKSVTADATLTNRDAVVLVDTTGGLVTVYLPYANTWSPPDGKKTPVLVIQRTAGTAAIQIVASGSDTIIRRDASATNAVGNFFMLYSTGATSWYDIGTTLNGSMLAKTTYSSGSGTHTFNTATRYAIVKILGGGAGGGGGNNHSTAGNRVGGGGGGGGEYVEVVVIPSLEGASMAYVVGAKGTGGAGTSSTSAAGSDGTAGGFSSFGPYVAFGGSLGNGGGITGNNGKGGAGGGLVGAGAAGGVSDGAAVAATSGGPSTENIDKRMPGAGGGGAGRGTTAVYRDGAIGGVTLGRLWASAGTGSASGAGGGGGGSTMFGYGSNGGNQGVAASAATLAGTGGGGGGSGAGAGTSPAGGDGVAGFVIIEEY